MTACAMTVGMVPMALALERGSQMQAPLGRAVIGGLLMSTVATLLILPSVFAMVIGRRVASSPSIYPDDPDSTQFDPDCYKHMDEFDKKVQPSEDYAVWEEPTGKPAEQPGGTGITPTRRRRTIRRPRVREFLLVGGTP